jgi:hypothetical protein
MLLIAAGFVAALVPIANVALAQDAQQAQLGDQALAYLAGWVVDEACGKANANPEGADCVRRCVKEEGSPVAFYSTERDKLYRITDPKPALAYVGREIHVVGFVNEKEKTIKVGSYVDKDTRRQVVGPPVVPEEDEEGQEEAPESSGAKTKAKTEAETEAEGASGS